MIARLSISILLAGGLCGCQTIKCQTIKCVTIGQQYVVTFDMEDGVPITQTETVASDNHPRRGQCGSGTTATGFTMDCLVHDACHGYAKQFQGTNGIRMELPGGLGPNCLDEFEPAIDDYGGSLPKCDGI